MRALPFLVIVSLAARAVAAAPAACAPQPGERFADVMATACERGYHDGVLGARSSTAPAGPTALAWEAGYARGWAIARIETRQTEGRWERNIGLVALGLAVVGVAFGAAELALNPSNCSGACETGEAALLVAPGLAALGALGVIGGWLQSRRAPWELSELGAAPRPSDRVQLAPLVGHDRFVLAATIRF